MRGAPRLSSHYATFAGDDVTDEDAIAVLDPLDVGIWVGPGESTAKFRLPRAEAVSFMLESLATQRGNARP
jgi:trehalose 6-phosphate phosphatase